MIVAKNQPDRFWSAVARRRRSYAVARFAICGHSQTMPPKAIRQPISVSMRHGDKYCSPLSVQKLQGYTTAVF